MEDTDTVGLDRPFSGWPASGCVPVMISTGDEAWRRGASHRLDAVVPPRIADVGLTIPAELLGRIVDAERALSALDHDLASFDFVVLETLAFALLRTESVSSSRIEGVDVSHRRLAEALLNPRIAKSMAKEVIGNIDAMRIAVDLGARAEPFGPNDLLELHRVLMASVPAFVEGAWRAEQNWIGTADLPGGAVYVPPPPAMLGELIADLCDYINKNPAPSVVRAAIVHAQFEAIHPFIDGNGRVGRCLISVVFRKVSGTHSIPPVSGVLLSDTAGYFAALHEYQQNANPLPWVGLFADATVAACAAARSLAEALAALQASWRSRLGSPREGSVIDRLIDRLPLLSFADADSVADALAIDPNVARRALNALEQAGIAKQVAAGRRNRVWRVDEVHRLLDEHSLGRSIVADP